MDKSKKKDEDKSKKKDENKDEKNNQKIMKMRMRTGGKNFKFLVVEEDGSSYCRG